MHDHRKGGARGQDHERLQRAMEPLHVRRLRAPQVRDDLRAFLVLMARGGMTTSKTRTGLALVVTSWMALEGCGGSSSVTPPPPTTIPPTTIPITQPTPDPLIAACGTPRPPALYGIKVKVQTDQGYRKLV